MDSLLEIKENKFVEIEIRKSKFLAFSFSIHSISEAEQTIKNLQQKYSDATHVCYAYKIGGQEKASDDGEPQGTAGKPILDCIKKKNLSNCMVVVVRYFGGIKLGAGGLVRAYSNSAKQVLDISEIAEKQACNKIQFEVDFSQAKNLKLLLSNQNILQHNINYAEQIQVTLFVLVEQVKKFVENLNCLLRTSVNIDDNTYYI